MTKDQFTLFATVLTTKEAFDPELVNNVNPNDYDSFVMCLTLGGSLESAKAAVAEAKKIATEHNISEEEIFKMLPRYISLLGILGFKI